MRNSDPDFLWGHLLTNGLCLVIGLHYLFSPPKKNGELPWANSPQLNEDTWKEWHQYIVQ